MESIDRTQSGYDLFDADGVVRNETILDPITALQSFYANLVKMKLNDYIICYVRDCTCLGYAATAMCRVNPDSITVVNYTVETQDMNAAYELFLDMAEELNAAGEAYGFDYLQAYISGEDPVREAYSDEAAR